MRVGVIGATGLVGRTFLQALPQWDLPIEALYLAASPASVGKSLSYQGQTLPVEPIAAVWEKKPDLVFFSAGAQVSKEWAPRFVEIGSWVIDNSSAWRMDPDVPLIVPEINFDTLGTKRLIANPNCSTIQLVMALYPLHKTWGLERVIVATYQAVTGTGQKAVNQLMQERQGKEPSHKVYPYAIDLNCIPQCDVFTESGYTKEEEKIIHETRKILSLSDLAITATAVRVPVLGGHSEVVNVTLKKPFTLSEVRQALAQMEGVILQDDPGQNLYPMPRMVEGQDKVFIGRLRQDTSHPHGLNMWIVADNLRKGAAVNALAIAKRLAQA
ncbi:MAG: aspartate-semialdehyde dehydrogenase [Bacteroidia bacterium]